MTPTARQPTMSTHHLVMHDHNATLELEERLPALIHHRATFDDALVCCQQYRIRAICALLLGARGDLLRVFLQRSGAVMLHFLQSPQATSVVTSKLTPLFDAIAAGDDTTSQQLAAAAAPIQWNANEEFEDDFLYFKFLTQFWFLGASPVDCEATLQRYEVVLEGNDEPRFDICRAFLDDDDERFEAGIQALIEAHAERWRKLCDAEVVAPEIGDCESSLCVEGLALLRLAERKGFDLYPDYLLIPSIARAGTVPQFQPDGWQFPNRV